MSGRLHSQAKVPRGPKGSSAARGSKGSRSSKGSRGSKGSRSSKATVRGPRKLLGALVSGSSSRDRAAPSASRKLPQGMVRAQAKPKGRPSPADTRRHRIPLALAALFALAVLGTSFPLSTLLSQHRQLSAAAAQLHQLQSENRLLAEQEQQLHSNAEIDRLARQDYQLVMPGQTLYDVLPASGQSGDRAGGGTTSGDPGDQPLVAPSEAPDMTPDPGLPHAPAPSGTSGSGSGASSGAAGSGSSGRSAPAGTGPAADPSSFWSRVTTTLEFWK